MKWTQSYPTPSAIWPFAYLAYHLRLDPDVANTTPEQDFVLDLQKTAVEYAETAMACSLLTRTVTAVFSGPSAPDTFGYVYGWDWRHRLRLPRGPILSGLTSVTDANGTVSPSHYTLDGEGNNDYLRMGIGFAEPLTVVYQAGYGSTRDAIPRDICHALRMHIGTMYESRESIGVGKASIDIPQSLLDFYRLKSRVAPVG